MKAFFYFSLVEILDISQMFDTIGLVCHEFSLLVFFSSPQFLFIILYSLIMFSYLILGWRC